MIKRYCDICKQEMGSMRVRYQLTTIYPELLTKEKGTEDICHPCVKKARFRMNQKEETA